MNSRMKLLIVGGLSAILAAAATCGGVYFALHYQKPEVSQREEKNIAQVSEKDKIYKDAIQNLEDKDYEAAYQKLKELKESGTFSDSTKNVQELYCYTLAKRYLQQGNKLSANEIIAKIPESYMGVYSNEISALKKELSQAVTRDNVAPNNTGMSDSESQRLLKAKLENINVRLSNQLAAIYDQQERDNIAYNEGAMGIRPYYTNRAQYDIDIQNARLSAVVEELQEIKKAHFSSEEEKQILINTTEERKKRIEQERSKALIGKEEVIRVSQESEVALSNLYATLGR